jgi:uncharacterized membrane protein SirB2
MLVEIASLGDVLFAFTQWLRGTPLVELALWLSNEPVSLVIQTNFWAIPVIQTVHILAIATIFGSALMVNLRILGVGRGGHTLDATARRYLPLIWWALAVLLVSGIGLVIGEPVRELINPVFWSKMGLIVIAVVLNVLFQAVVRRRMAGWEVASGGAIGVRVSAAGLILLWCVIMVAGRWIAYAPV